MTEFEVGSEFWEVFVNEYVGTVAGELQLG